MFYFIYLLNYASGRVSASKRDSMAQRLRSERSTEAPMDFQFTSRPNVDVVPVWKNPATPLKREHTSRLLPFAHSWR